MHQPHQPLLHRVSRPGRAAASGFTLIELLIVLAIIGVMAAVVMPIMPATLVSRDVETSAALAVDALRQAQGNVMTGRGFKRWGVHFQADRFTLFSGASYSTGATDNVVTMLTGRVRVTGIALTPGGACTVATGIGNCDVHFAQTEGVPTEAGIVTFTSGDGEVRTVTVGVAGLTNFQ